MWSWFLQIDVCNSTTTAYEATSFMIERSLSTAVARETDRFKEIAAEFWFGPQACGVSASVETCRIGTFHRFALTRAVTVNYFETAPVRHFFWHVVILLREDLVSSPISVPELAGLTRAAHDALTTHSARKPSLIRVSIASP